MKNPIRCLVAGAVVGLLPYLPARSQGLFTPRKDTYRFDKPASELPEKLPKTSPGRVHFSDGTTLAVPLAYLDYNKIVAVENGVGKVYNTLEVNSFVIKQDSFAVFQNFKVTDGEDEQEFRRAFVLVNVVGPGFILYRFSGTMRHDDAVSHRSGTAFNGTTWGGTSTRNTAEATEYKLTTVWLVKRDGDPRWLSLPKAGAGLRSVIAPIIADDKKLSRSMDWEYASASDVPRLLKEYVAHKQAAAAQP